MEESAVGMYRKPLVITTEGSPARPAFGRALQIARAAGGEVTAIDVAEPLPAQAGALLSPATLEALQTALTKQRTAEMDALAAEAAASGVALKTKLTSGSAFQVAIRAVLENGHDVLIKTIAIEGSESRATQGSLDRHLLRKCPCPVWLVAASDSGKSERIAAAVNPDPDDPEEHALSIEILRIAAAIANLDGAGLHVLHAWRVFGELLLRGPTPLVSDPEVDWVVGKAMNRHARFLDELIADTPLSGVTPAIHLVHARPADAIIDLVRSSSPDLLVMGSVGRTGIPGFFIGSTAERVFNEVTCSVLALKPHGFVSPVTLEPKGSRATSST